MRTVERRQDRDGPFRQSSADMLTSEYKRGLKIGGIEGGSICRGVIRAANELGVSVEEVVGPIRSDRHNESVDRARRLEYAADVISTKAPQPPRSIVGRSPRRGRDGANLHTHRIAPALLGGEREVIPQETRCRGSSRAKK